MKREKRVGSKIKIRIIFGARETSFSEKEAKRYASLFRKVLVTS